ncbi:MAG: dual specificity protein phosphatase family protein [Chloroflexota bacterium]|nr:dual specificity protein phosphatase family protein [Chloroflexota bacterium]
MDGFYWLEDGVLAGSRLPGARRRGSGYSTDTDHVEEDLAVLREQGIGAILSLTETPLEARALSRAGIDAVHIPIPDMTAPSGDQIRLALAYIDRHVAERRPVVVHCLVGQGRTGTILAAYLIRAGATTDEALVRVRSVCPNAVENDAQVAALRTFEAGRGWVL